MSSTDLSVLVGLTLVSCGNKNVTQSGDRDLDSPNILEFAVNDGRKFELWHSQDCCESVYIDDINGDMDDLVGAPILVAEEATGGTANSPWASRGLDQEQCEADAVLVALSPKPEFTPTGDCLYTFYRFTTIKGTVVVRWLGQSEYYSVSVDFRQVA